MSSKEGGKPLTKSEVYSQLADKAEVQKKDVQRVFEALEFMIKEQLSKKGPGQFVIPGLLKLKVVRKPATKARMGINPFTKEPMEVKAKPAKNVVKASALKNLKDLVA